MFRTASASRTRSSAAYSASVTSAQEWAGFVHLLIISSQNYVCVVSARHPADCPPDRVTIRVVAVSVPDLHHAVRARGRKNVACQRSAQRLGWVHDGAGITVLTGISGQRLPSVRHV